MQKDQWNRCVSWCKAS